ncbi:class I SAM-dependent methyltransferase [Porifericola rhodea]|uniref:O-methyltransferase n=1 Tax=Porifericola rhodea TaxID=930972 RepID=UPI0026666AE8|nr:class I SAM-dependent methyltransferase [Porifericola rhodea]WKN30470.1 class I SAM-dependent methyltransferase [Porifericola rhodea]
MSRFSLVKGYIHHWLHAVNRHSLHAPFVYQLYEKVIAADNKEAIFDSIEAYRRSYLQNPRAININSPGAPSQASKQQNRKVSNIAAHSLSQARFSRMLFRLIQSQNHTVIIELGTSLGINTLYMSAANPDAEIYTFEGCANTAQLARQLFNEWPYKNIKLIEGNIDQTLPQSLRKLPKVDMAYLDANHRYVPTLNYFQQLRAKTHEQSVLILDDIYWSNEMRQAWVELYQRPDISLSLDLFDAGMLFFNAAHMKQHHALMF